MIRDAFITGLLSHANCQRLLVAFEQARTLDLVQKNSVDDEMDVDFAHLT